jgi:hypothetical protein
MLVESLLETHMAKVTNSLQHLIHESMSHWHQVKRLPYQCNVIYYDHIQGVPKNARPYVRILRYTTFHVIGNFLN